MGIEEFQLHRLDPVACYLELDGDRISAVPAFDAPGTGASGVTGTLSLSNREDAILVAQLSPRSVYTGEYDGLRRYAAHRALVIVCTGAKKFTSANSCQRTRYWLAVSEPLFLIDEVE